MDGLTLPTYPSQQFPKPVFKTDSFTISIIAFSPPCFLYLQTKSKTALFSEQSVQLWTLLAGFCLADCQFLLLHSLQCVTTHPSLYQITMSQLKPNVEQILVVFYFESKFQSIRNLCYTVSALGFSNCSPVYVWEKVQTIEFSRTQHKLQHSATATYKRVFDGMRIVTQKNHSNSLGPPVNSFWAF